MAAKKSKSAKSTGESGLNKADFIRSFSPDTKASEIVERAKAEGLTISAAYVHVLRSKARKGGAAVQPRKKQGKAPQRAAVRASVGNTPDLLQLVSDPDSLERARHSLEGRKAELIAELDRVERLLKIITAV